jgi:ubiquinone biosynthesis protein
VISVFSAVKDLVRLREITTVLVRHGFGEVAFRLGAKRKAATEETEAVVLADDVAKGEEEKKRVSTAERVRLVLQDLGPSFIKLGQIASTRTDLLPPEVIFELKKLQDDVPPVPFEEIKHVVESTLNEPIDQVFASFDEKPLATASIGQVHRAVLGDTSVVVKVQRPNVGATVHRDVEILHILAAALERALPETKIYSPTGLVQQFDRSITAELNFMVEGENGERFAKNFEGSDVVRFPKVFKEASGNRVLTLEFFDGLKIDKAIDAGIDGKLVAKNAVGVVIKMIFDDGFFHADPHPGNIIIMGGLPPDTAPPPVIGLIDLGMVGRLSPELRDRTIDLMVGAVRKDAYAVADALYTIGRPTRKIDMREYRADVATLAEKYLGKPLKEIDLSAMIRDLVQGAMKYGLEIPPDFMLVGKSLMTLEGIGKQLDPDLDVFGEAQPYFMKLLRQRYSPQRLGNELLRGVEQLSRAGYDVPLQAREILEDLRLGRLVVKTADPELPVVVDRLGRRLFSGLVVAATTLGGAASFAHDRFLGGVLLGVSASLLVLHVLRDVRR